MTYRSYTGNSRPQKIPDLPDVPPHAVVKQGTVLHVYPPNRPGQPVGMTPMATYDREGDWWVRRGKVTERHRFIPQAARAACDPDRV